VISAALVDVPPNLGYPLLFALVGAESAGALVPGETALIVAGALAAQGRLGAIGLAALAVATIAYLVIRLRERRRDRAASRAASRRRRSSAAPTGRRSNIQSP
jgi:membrane protein DedA with SNARE-associated domain